MNRDDHDRASCQSMLEVFAAARLARRVSPTQGEDIARAIELACPLED